VESEEKEKEPHERANNITGPDFYAWQCISLLREFSSLDFIV